MSDKSGMGLLFKLAAEMSPEDRESARRGMAEAFMYMLPTTGAGVAEAVAAVVHMAEERGEMIRAAMAQRFAGAAQVAEAVSSMGRQMAAAVAEIARPDGYFAQVVREAQEAQRLFAEHVASLPEEEREELRRLAEDAPLCEVDVNATGVM